MVLKENEILQLNSPSLQRATDNEVGNSWHLRREISGYHFHWNDKKGNQKPRNFVTALRWKKSD